MGGATWSYHPPQSSHVMIMAVFFQYWLVPMAFTTDATHEGPSPVLDRAWSEDLPSGMTQLTAGSCPLEMSVSTWVSMTTLLIHSGLVQGVPGPLLPHMC